MNFRQTRILLFAAMLVISLAPVLVLGYRMGRSEEQILRERTVSHLTTLADDGADITDSFVGERLGDMRVLSRAGVGTSALEVAQRDKVSQSIRSTYRVYRTVFITDAAGRVTGNPAGTPPPDDSPLLQAAMQEIRAGREYVGNPYLDSGSGELLFLIAVPISGGGRSAAMAGAILGLKPVADWVRQVQFGQTAEVLVVSGDGHLLASSRVGRRIFEDRLTLDQPHGAGKSRIIVERVDYRGKRVLRVQQRAVEAPWFSIAEFNVDEFKSLINIQRGKAIGWALAMFLFNAAAAGLLVTLIVNSMERTDRRERELEFQMVQKDRLASMGLLTAGMAHELNTPLANALVYVQMTMEEVGEPGSPLRANLSIAEDQIRHCAHIVHNLLDFARRPHEPDTTADVNTLLAKVLKIAEPYCIANHIDIERKIESGLPAVAADPDVLQQIFANVCANALEAMQKGGVLTVTTSFLSPSKRIRVEIADTGRGISRDKIDQVFDPFYTTKREAGIGLGLFLSRNMIKQLGGNIYVASATAEEAAAQGGAAGAVFTIELPVDAAPLDPLPETA